MARAEFRSGASDSDWRLVTYALACICPLLSLVVCYKRDVGCTVQFPEVSVFLGASAVLWGCAALGRAFCPDLQESDDHTLRNHAKLAQILAAACQLAVLSVAIWWFVGEHLSAPVSNGCVDSLSFRLACYNLAAQLVFTFAVMLMRKNQPRKRRVVVGVNTIYSAVSTTAPLAEVELTVDKRGQPRPQAQAQPAADSLTSTHTLFHNAPSVHPQPGPDSLPNHPRIEPENAAESLLETVRPQTPSAEEMEEQEAYSGFGQLMSRASVDLSSQRVEADLFTIAPPGTDPFDDPSPDAPESQTMVPPFAGFPAVTSDGATAASPVGMDDSLVSGQIDVVSRVVSQQSSNDGEENSWKERELTMDLSSHTTPPNAP